MEEYQAQLNSISCSTPEGRKEYSKVYYQQNKEKWKNEYNPVRTIKRKNNVEKKKKNNRHKKSQPKYVREVIRTTFNTTDLMHAPVEKTLRMLEKIISGERYFIM